MGKVEQAREAFTNGSWSAVVDNLRDADSVSELPPDDRMQLAVALQLVGEYAASKGSFEQAYRANLDTGDPAAASRCAWWLGLLYMNLGDPAQGAGWLGRAAEVLEHVDGECVEQGYLLASGGLQALHGGDSQRAQELFESVKDTGAHFQDTDLLTLGRLGQGQAQLQLDHLAEGVAQFDEAMIAVVTGEVSPLVAGIVYCAVVEACQEKFDLARAREWTGALSSWCGDQPELVPFRGQCLVHRSEILALDGDLPAALVQAEQARDLLSDPPGQPPLGAAYYQLAQLHRLRGEMEPAESAYRMASQHGREPQPGLALLRLAQGNAETADAALRRVLDEGTLQAHRPRLLAARVETALATGDADGANAAAKELSATADSLAAPFVAALAAYARGLVALAVNDGRGALAELREACSTWRETGGPYEVARAREAIGHACVAVGDLDGADLELDAAMSAFSSLGAAIDVARVEEAEAEIAAPAAARPADSSGLTGRELEVLRHVATGETNRQIAAALVISEKTVARHVANIFTKLDVSSRSAATAYAFRHHLA